MVKVFMIDYPLFRRGVASLLEGHPEFQVVGEAANTLEALPKMEEIQPDIVVIDVFTPGGEGVEAITLLQQKCPQVKVLILTESEKKDNCSKAIKAGAKGYLLKGLELEELIDSIHLVSSGSAIVYSSRAASLLDVTEELKNKNGFNSLSRREKEVLWFVAQGDSNKEIAVQCYVSETTIKAHLRRIAEKLEVKNRAQAVAKGIERGLLNES